MRHGKASVLEAGCGWWQPLITDGVLTQRAAKKAVCGSRRPVIDRKIDAFVSNDGVGLLCRQKSFLLVSLQDASGLWPAVAAFAAFLWPSSRAPPPR